MSRLDLPRLARLAILPTAILIAYLSLKPVGDTTSEGPWLLRQLAEWLLGDPSQIDKVGHYLAYATLAGTACMGLIRRVPLVIILGAVLAYGALFEGLQSLTPNRTASFADMLANTLGALTGLVIGWLVGHLTPGDSS